MQESRTVLTDSVRMAKNGPTALDPGPPHPIASAGPLHWTWGTSVLSARHAHLSCPSLCKGPSQSPPPPTTWRTTCNPHANLTSPTPNPGQVVTVPPPLTVSPRVISRGMRLSPLQPGVSGDGDAAAPCSLGCGALGQAVILCLLLSLRSHRMAR